jgi:hypothetical protein
VDKPRYTGPRTWLGRLAARLFRLNDWKEQSEKVFHEEAPDLKTYPRAFARYLEGVKLPGDDGLTEYERLRHNQDLWDKLLTEARLEVKAEAFEEHEEEAAEALAWQKRLEDKKDVKRLAEENRLKIAYNEYLTEKAARDKARSTEEWRTCFWCGHRFKASDTSEACSRHNQGKKL